MEDVSVHGFIGNKREKFLALLFVLALILNNSFFFSFQSIYYVILCSIWLIAVVSILNSKSTKFHYLIIFIVAIACSLLVNHIPAFFGSFERFILLFILITLLGPIVNNGFLDRFRNNVFRYFININIFICSLSFILLVLGIHSGRKINLVFGNERNDFAGLYGHSMILGPMSVISVLTSIYFFQKASSRFYKVLFIITGILSFLSCVQAGSRNALLGLLISGLYFLFKSSGGKIAKFSGIIFLIVVVAVLAFPLYESNFTYLFSKFDTYNQGSSITVSRDSKWLNRLEEFYSSPIFGIGYGSVSLSSNDYSENGVIETGSSWLGILSMTGLFGFVPMCYFFFSSILVKFRRKEFKDQYYYLVISVFILFAMNMVFEGSALAAGTINSAMIWLSFGLVNSINKTID